MLENTMPLDEYAENIEYIEDEENDAQINLRSERFDKIAKRLFLLCAVMLAAELVWLFLITPSMPFSRINVIVDGNTIGENEERSQLLFHAGITRHSSFFWTDADKMAKRILGSNIVEAADVTKVFPDSLSINVVSRKPVGLVLQKIGGRTESFCFDKHGVFYKTGRPTDGRPAEGLPVISGLEVEEVRLGFRLPLLYEELFESLYTLKMGAPELFETISEIQINNKSYDRYDIVLYPQHSRVKIRLENKIDEETIRYMLLMLDVLEAKGTFPDEIDFRAGTASFVLRS
jgi:cell division protein FtsQ